VRALFSAIGKPVRELDGCQIPPENPFQVYLIVISMLVGVAMSKVELVGDLKQRTFVLGQQLSGWCRTAIGLRLGSVLAGGAGRMWRRGRRSSWTGDSAAGRDRPPARAAAARAVRRPALRRGQGLRPRRRRGPRQRSAGRVDRWHPSRLHPGERGRPARGGPAARALEAVEKFVTGREPVLVRPASCLPVEAVKITPR
jgi:hypothetical protein